MYVCVYVICTYLTKYAAQLVHIAVYTEDTPPLATCQLDS